MRGKTTNNNGKKRKRKKEVIKALVKVGIVVLLAVGAYAVMALALWTTHPLTVVTSDSMEPTLMKGDVLIIRGVRNFENEIVIGDHDARNGSIIVFWAPWSEPWEDPTVHRVVDREIDNETGKYLYRTQGDNWWHVDTELIPQDSVIGVYVAKIPYIGYLRIWLTESYILIPLIIGLGILLFWSILKDMKQKDKEREINPSKISDEGPVKSNGIDTKLDNGISEK